MPHINLPERPGIRALFQFRPETAKPLTVLAETLLRAPSSLSRGERELIAAAFCMYNRYVDGLATLPLDDEAGYAAMAPHIVEHGYVGVR